MSRSGDSDDIFNVILPHLPYSSALSHRTDLFPKLKELGKRYDNLNSLEEEMANQVRHINLGCLATGIRDHPHRWTSVIEKKGCNIE